MNLLSIQLGKPRNVEWRGRSISTGIFKSPVTGSVNIHALGIKGDGQADLTVHGGRDKAVYAYGWDTLSWWQTNRSDHEYEYGKFGENLTVSELKESEMFAGSIYQIGTAKLQVSEPRFPCFKLGIRFDNDASIIESFVEARRPGVYFRVIEEGSITAGDTLELLEEDQAKVSVVDMFDTALTKPDRARIERLLSVKSLTPGWRSKFQAKLADL